MPTTKKTKPRKKPSNNLGPKKKTLFDHINHIREKKNEKYFDTLTDEDKKTFVNYMVNRFLSMDMNLIEAIDEILYLRSGESLHQIKESLIKNNSNILPTLLLDF